MEYAAMKALLEAQFLMGYDHAVQCYDENTGLLTWYWEPRTVRGRLQVPRNALWEARLYALESEGLATLQVMGDFICDVDPERHELVERPGWQDEPREANAEWHISPAGVLRLAQLYDRPYVRVEESRAVFDHWDLLRDLARRAIEEPRVSWTEAREAQWRREWPEKALYHEAMRDHWERLYDEAETPAQWSL